MADIYLINPSRLERSPALYPPLGLGYISAVLRENGYAPKVLDLNFDPDLNQIKNIRDVGSVYGFTSTTSQFKFASEVASMIKERDPNGKIIFGGAHPTVLPQNVLDDESIDVAVVGEAEETILELMEAFENDKEVEGIRGIWHKKDGKKIENPRRPFIDDLDSLPFPVQHDFPVEEYFKAKGLRELSLITSRGCPGNCRFCQPTVSELFGRKLRYRSPANVVDEINWMIEKFGLDMLVISDDTFVSNKKHVEGICKEIIERDIQVLWRCQTRVGLKKEAMETMKRSGCFLVALGVESGSQDMLDKMNKGTTVNGVMETFKTCREVGILAHAFLMVGYPGETRGSILKTFELLRKIKPFTTRAAITTPYPGTHLFDSAMADGLLSDPDILEYDHLFGEPVLNLPTLSKEEVKEARGSMEAYSSKPERIMDIMRLLKDLVLVKKLIRMSLNDPSFFRRMIALSIRSLEAKGTGVISPYLNKVRAP